MTSTIEADSVDTFLADLARISTTSTGAIMPSIRPGTVLARRYELQSPVGRGAHGVVWAARDSLTGSDVAVKVLVTTTKSEAARVCAEVAALRRLRLPGVVSLVDDGMEQGSLFLVMPFVAGRPFPGKDVPAAWSEIEASVSALLSILAQVHAAGIVHRDLKPANVIVDDAGHPTILDFGLALAPTFEGLLEEGRIAGTPAFLSPEQASGGSIGAPADLYAVGVMVYRALSGRYPYEEPTVVRLLAAKRTAARPLDDVAPHVPPHVASAVDALLAVRPERRPGSALEALERFGLSGDVRTGARPQRSTSPRLPESITPESLRDLFEGKDRLFWRREDAARLLFERSSGDPARIRREIDAWVRIGWCRWGAGPEARLVVDDETIERLQVGTGIAALEDPLAFAERAIEDARSLAETGRLGNATALLQEALSALRRAPTFPTSIAMRALSLWVEIAIVIGTPSALDHALYEICRMDDLTPLVGELEALVRAALAVGAWTDRALELASALAPFDDPALERARQGVRVDAARRASLEREEELMEELQAWARDARSPDTDAAFFGWMGRLRYRQGRFEEAAELHGRAAALSTWATKRAWSLVSQANALMEAFSFDHAAEVAARAVGIASTTRHAYGRAFAEWVVRIIGYRRGEPLSPDVELIEEISALQIPELEALVCLTEAAIAWRSGFDDVAHAVALRGQRLWRSVGERGGGLLLISAVAVASAPSAPEQAGIADLIADAIACNVPGIGIQVLGLVSPRRSGDPFDAATVDALAAQVDKRHWSSRIDVLSVAEALARINPGRRP